MKSTINCKKTKKSSNIIKASAQPRTWTAVSEVVKKADVEIHQINGDTSHVLLSILKRKNKSGQIIENCNLFPKWTIMYKGIRVKKDLLDFLTIIKDTLLEYDPLIKIYYRCGSGVKTVHGRIVGFIGTKSDDGLYDKFKNPYNCHFNIKLNKGESLPPVIRRFQINITGKLLAKNIYKYGFCSKTDARFHDCSDIQYIRNTGDIYWAYGTGRCYPHDLRKGDPNQYCGFVLGN